MSGNFSIEELDAMSDESLCELQWKSLSKFNARLLDLHAEGALGNEEFAKLPRRPILCVDRIELIDESNIEASFAFPEDPDAWAFDPFESLEMLFQDQLDQLVGFWGSRKADGIGRALSSGKCKLHSEIKYEPGKTLHFRLSKRKWISSKESEGGTAVFNGHIEDAEGNTVLETKNVIVGILRPAEVHSLRKQYGGLHGVTAGSTEQGQKMLCIPVYDSSLIRVGEGNDSLQQVTATQLINPDVWPLKYHFKGDPVMPGNFGTHGMIALLKEVAITDFGLKNPVFHSMDKKNFSGMVFEDTKQIRFELKDVKRQANGEVVAAEANMYLEDRDGNLMIEHPIYTFKNPGVCETSATS